MKLRLDIVRPVAFAVFTFLFILQIVVVFQGVPLGAEGRADFRHLYTAGYMVRSGHSSEIYDFDKSGYFLVRLVGSGSPPPFDHMAYETLLFVPFSFLGYKAAYFAFLVFNLFLLAASAVMLRPHITGLGLIGKAAPWGLLFSFLPVGFALILGQDSLILLTLMIASFSLLEGHRDFAAGFVLALGMFKFQFVIPIGLLFLLWRRWKVLGGTLSGATLTIGASLWITGIAGLRPFFRTLSTMITGLATDAEKYRYGTYPELMPNIRGLICTLAGNSSGKGIIVATVLCSIVLIAFAARKKPSFPLAILAAILVSYHGSIQDTSLLAVPVARTLSTALPEGRTLAFCAAAIVFVCPALLFMLLGTYSWTVLPILILMLSSSS